MFLCNSLFFQTICGTGGIGIVDQLGIIGPLGQLAGFLHHILETVEGVFCHKGRGIPGINLLIAFRNLFQNFQIRVREEVCNGLRNFLGCCRRDPLLCPGDGIGEFLNDFGVLFYVACLLYTSRNSEKDTHAHGL